jgi:dTMP kinase
MFENKDDLIKVRKRAMKLAQGWHVINTISTIEEVNDKINTILDEVDKNHSSE